jgi:D-sedoheptulose 7-phosphate isomerase
LLAISTSGKSVNIINAIDVANALNMSIISLTGKYSTQLEQLSDVCIVTPGGNYADRVQEIHIKIIHILIELVERYFHPENY